MRLYELEIKEEMLEEEEVLSSWIDELNFDGQNVAMTLLNGYTYFIYDVDQDLFDEWLRAPSKGKFWHEYIRDYYLVSRV